MKVSDFKTSSEQKLAKLAEMLNQMYGIQIDWESPEQDLESVLSHYGDKRSAIVAEASNVNMNAEYTKSVLITEAIRIYLREIAPVRKKKTRRTQ